MLEYLNISSLDYAQRHEDFDNELISFPVSIKTSF